jgi:hypothetical protein
MNAGPVFVFSSGRSGSTLVQRILNSYEDVAIWGEHGGFLADVAAGYFKLLEHPSNKKFLFSGDVARPTGSWHDVQSQKGSQNWQAWMNWFGASDIDDRFRTLVRSLFTPPGAPTDLIWGFKEIRYGLGDRVIEFLSRLYPDAQFVFLVRNGLNTVSSQLTTFHPAGTRGRRLRQLGLLPVAVRRSRQWRTQNEHLWHWHQSGRLRSHWVRFEDLIAGQPQLDGVLSAIGKEFGAVQRAVVLAEEGRGESQHVAAGVNERWRDGTALSTACIQFVIRSLNAELGYS